MELGFPTFYFVKMTQKSILLFLRKPNDEIVQESGSAEAETSDASISEPFSELPNKKKKFKHVYQDEWAEIWPFLRKTWKKFTETRLFNYSRFELLPLGTHFSLFFLNFNSY